MKQNSAIREEIEERSQGYSMPDRLWSPTGLSKMEWSPWHQNMMTG